MVIMAMLAMLYGKATSRYVIEKIKFGDRKMTVGIIILALMVLSYSIGYLHGEKDGQSKIQKTSSRS